MCRAVTVKFHTRRVPRLALRPRLRDRSGRFRRTLPDAGPRRPFQTLVLGAADQRGDGAATRAAGTAEEVRVRDATVFRHRRLQRLLCRSRGFQRRDEDRPDAQPALHGFRRAHRPEEESQRLQGTPGVFR